MKRMRYIWLGIAVILGLTACSNDFLKPEEAEWYQFNGRIEFDNFKFSETVTLEIPAAIDTRYSVFMHPAWIDIPEHRGKVEKGRIELTIKTKDPWMYLGGSDLNGQIVIRVEKFGFLILPVSYLVESTVDIIPTLEFTPVLLTFSGSYSETIRISTSYPDNIDWLVEEIPDWLDFSTISGSVSAGTPVTLTVRLDTLLVPPGKSLAATVKFNTPQAGLWNYNIHVTSESLPRAESSLTGSILTCADFHHESGIMAICTRAPNQLILFNTKSGNADTLALDKTPSCISFSADGRNAIMGYTVESVGYLDIDNATIIEEYALDFVPHDVAHGDNGWCYITPSGYPPYLRNLNLATGEITRSGEILYQWHALSGVIRKVPGAPLLIASRLNTSPSGLLVIDISEGAASESVTYYHENLGRFWLSKDGSRIYASYAGVVYVRPEFVIDPGNSLEPSVYGRLYDSWDVITTLDECPATNSLFCNIDNRWSGEPPYGIEHYNTVSLNRTRTMYTSPVRLSVSGKVTSHDTYPVYIFAAREGDALYVVKALQPKYAMKGWAIEKIDL